MAKNEYLKKVIDGIKFRYQLNTQQQISERLGYSSKTYLSDLLGGKSPLSEDFSDKMKEIFKVNPKFLLQGEGTIWIDETDNEALAQNEDSYMTDTEIPGNVLSTLDKAIEEISEQRKLVAKSQEQIDRLLVIIEKLNGIL